MSIGTQHRDKVFFVTGSARGLGRHIAEAVLAAGHRLAATARNPAQLADLTAEYGDRIRAIDLDVADFDAANRAVRAAVEAFGRIDVVVNNAGYGDLASAEDCTMEAFRAQVETNLFGVVNVTKAALPILRAQGAGHIIQISSVAGRLGLVGLSAYNAAKWAVGGFSESLALEVAPLGIKMSVLEPGGMRTDWAGSSMTIFPVSEPYQQTVGASAKHLERAGSTQLGDPVKVAQAVLTVAAMDEPPLRLLLGSDAVRYAGLADKARAEADERWRNLSITTDHDDATPTDKAPLSH